MTLTDAERMKFADYLEQDIDSDKLIINQMKTIGLPKSMISGREREATAKSIVLMLLKTTHSETIG